MSLNANIELGICSDGCDWDVTDCINKGYCYYEHKQELREQQSVCPICGKSMNETELNRQYCYDCGQKLKEGDR